MNRLGSETSPYLRQHRDNPVDWYPWGPEAFEAAVERDRPVLLSVGYSSCHWCHVMAHESFEDPDTAAIMNDLFVNVKVDREERPDVDAIYMDSVQAMTGRGGWPMTVFLAPDGRPFFGGTYYPDRPRGGMASFRQVMAAIDEAWTNRRSDVHAQADQLVSLIDRTSRAAAAMGAEAAPAGALDGRMLDRAGDAILSSFDPEWGGFGGAPKFPAAMTLASALRIHRRSDRPELLRVVRTSLDAMASGGIYDHLGGGFARYSVDHRWLVPHFEKMLYDNALLTRVYLHAWMVTGEAAHRQVVDETIGYVLRDLRHPDGGFYSAEDADSEGVEGKFYVWSEPELRAVVRAAAGAGADDEAVAWWGVTAAGNFEGANILNRPVRG
ncbi:MAG: thioredoxin domain-containing protein, partial [Acidimicrobiaceae bacterium]|nr:thioredoxin domain-containing protein [Acidimicrobiaceae bacterium]